MDIPYDVIAVFVALAIWAGLLLHAFRAASFRNFLGFGVALLAVLNVRYFIDGAPDSISFFVAIYDVLGNVGVSSTDAPAAMAACADNACSAWGDRFDAHPSWGVAFYDRFTTGPTSRTNLLYGHIGANTIAFLLMHYQLLRPGTGADPARHRLLGRIGFGAVTIGTLCAVFLAAQHDTVEEYGGPLSMLGFWFMSFCVYGCAVMAVRSIRSGNIAAHRMWSIRFAGSMWGAYWLFRVMLFVLDPLLRSVESAALLICIWFSAPLGILIAERFRRRQSAPVGTSPALTDAFS